MAFNAGTVKGTLDLNVQKFKRGASEATSSLKKTGAAAKSAGGNVKRFGSGFKLAAAGAVAAIAGLVAVRAALTKVVGILKGASAAQREYEQSVQSFASALILQGAPAVAKTTAELEAFATVVQDTTRFGDTQIIDTAKALTAFGAPADKIREMTKVVLDAAEAFDLDAKTAARSFGQALAGNAATLGRYIPAVRGLTQEQLKAGAAFDLVGKKVSGFSELAAKTTGAALTQAANAANDLRKRLGAAFNEFLGPIATQLRDLFRNLTNQLGEGTAGYTRLVETMRAGFTTVLSLMRFVVEALLTIRVGFKALEIAGALWQAGWVHIITGIISGFTKVSEVISRIIASTAEFIARIPGLSSGIKSGLQDVATWARQAAESNRQTLSSMSDLRQAARDVVKERKAEFDAARQTLDVVKNNKETDDERVAAVRDLVRLRVQESGIEASLRKIKEQQLADENRAAAAAAAQLEAIKSRLQHLREINGVSGTAFRSAEATAAATENIANAAESAAVNVSTMADEFGRAAQGASEAASAAAAVGGGAFAGTRTLSASRTAVSQSAIDFSDPFRAAALATQASATLGRISAGGKRADIGFSGVRAARAFADSVHAEAAAAVDRAIADYTATIIQELNSAGIMSPDERSRIIRQRISEAQRLGIVPSRRSLEPTNVGLQ